MLTRYDPFTEGAANMAMIRDNMERRVPYEQNTAFMQACNALEIADGLPPNTIYMHAGNQCGAHPGPFTYVETPEQCLEAYRYLNPKPLDLKGDRTQAALARSRERDAKQAAQDEYAHQYSAYVTACRERKERIEAAKQRCNAVIWEANRVYSAAVVQAAMARDESTREVRQLRDAAIAEPVPSPPGKRQ